MLAKLLTTPTTQLGRAGKFAVFQIKLWSHCVKLLKKNRSGQQAAALSYHTIFGIVPLAIVMLLIFQLFPASSEIGNKVTNLIYDELNLSTIEYAPDSDSPDQKVKLTDNIDKIVGQFFGGANTGAVTIFSLAIVIWAAVALLSTVERSFNRIWHIAHGRRFLQRTINYWALLTLGPLLLGLSIYITTKLTLLGQLQQTILSTVTPALVSFIIATIAFFLLYFVLPNTRVQTKAAIWGAVVAALLWVIAKNMFGYYLTHYKPYASVYGVMALIPITVLWIYITWQIVLFGLQLTFTTQHLKSLDAAEIAAAHRREDYFIANDITAINIVREIADAFERNSAPVESGVICSKLNMPAEFGDKILNLLVTRGILLKSSDPKEGYVPAQDPANIKLSQIAEAVAAAGFGQSSPEEPPALTQIKQTQRDNLAQHSIKQLLKDL